MQHAAQLDSAVTSICYKLTDTVQVANHTIAILLGLIYCIIQPVIAPLVLFYCLIAYFIAKYQAIYVLRPAYESGGAVRKLLSRCRDSSDASASAAIMQVDQSVVHSISCSSTQLRLLLTSGAACWPRC